MLDGIFYGTKDFLIHDVACIADDEEVAELLVEDDLRCHAAVGAAEDHGKGVLTFAESLSVFDIRVVIG
jgi:hypothetical protein